MRALLRLLLYGVAVSVAAYIIPGISVSNFGYALLVALILTIINLTIKPVLQILTLPITLLTFGFFLLVINALMVMLTDYLLRDFNVEGFWAAMLFSIVSSITYWVLDGILGKDK